jgi:hypothetical protein
MRDMNHQLFQIFYNQETKFSNDSGFLPLDNTSNSRPDWSEYWPIRNYILNNPLRKDTYYGFFSPKFKAKTDLESQEVKNFLDKATEDVVIFCPFFDQNAIFVNIFEQALVNHNAIYKVLLDAYAGLKFDAEPQGLVMSSRDVIFCNFFAAKREFWSSWFLCCEKIWHMCEENKSDLAKALNESVEHDGKLHPAKTFIIERIATILLSNQNEWSVKVYNPLALPFMSGSRVAQFRAELVQLDAMKVAYRASGLQAYLDQFNSIRSNIIKMLNG